MDEAHFISSHPASSPDGQVSLGEGARVCARGWGWRRVGCKNVALLGVDLDIVPDERALVLDPSGSGRPTLMGSLAGLLGSAEEGDTTGALTVDGVVPAKARGHVGLLMQDPEAQVAFTRMDDDVAFGMENLGVAHGEIWPCVESSLGAVGLSVSLDHSTTELSGGQKQRLTLASILAVGPGLLLLDRPIANLDPSGVAEVHAAVETTVERTGVTVVVVEHRVDIWVSLVDRVTMVVDGVIIADDPLNGILAQQDDILHERGTWLPGDDVAAEVRPTPKVPSASPENPERGAWGTIPITRVTDLTIGYDASAPVHNDIDPTIKRGVSTYVVDANGAGKSTFVLTPASLLLSLADTVEVETAGGTDGDPRGQGSKQLLGRVPMVFQEPEYQFLAATVIEEPAINPRAAGTTDKEIVSLIDRYLGALGLTKLACANSMMLSGGEKHRLSVATMLISAPELLILDKPTFDQGRGTWLSLVRLLRTTLERGVTLVSITYDPTFVAAMSQCVVGLGQAGMCGTAPEDSTNEVGSAPAGNVHDRDPKRGARGFLVCTSPVARALVLLVATTPLLITVDPISTAVAVTLEPTFVPLPGVSAYSSFPKATPLLLTAPLGALPMLLYASSGGTMYWQFGPVVVSGHLMWLVLGIGLRMCATVLPAIALPDYIDLTDVGGGLAQTLHPSARPMLVALAGARMTSLMVAGWKAFERARRARGAGNSSRARSFPRDSFLLLVLTLRRSGKLATTMEAGGLGAEDKRARARPSRLCTIDVVLMVVVIALPAIALAASIQAGTLAPVGR